MISQLDVPPSWQLHTVYIHVLGKVPIVFVSFSHLIYGFID